LQVEGEMDKLAMEEAGFRNCVSVPDGAPPSVSPKELPPNQEVCVNFKIQSFVSSVYYYLLFNAVNDREVEKL
jgi:hypothetical protein